MPFLASFNGKLKQVLPAIEKTIWRLCIYIPKYTFFVFFYMLFFMFEYGTMIEHKARVKQEKMLQM